MRALVLDMNIPRYLACKLVGPFWPGVYYSSLSSFSLREIPEPVLPSPEWVRLRTIYSGICPSDISAVLLKYRYDSFLSTIGTFPLVLGHENLARVVEVGQDATDYRPGERVNVHPFLPCAARGINPLCPPCSEGRPSICQNFRQGPLASGSIIGGNRDTSGGWGEYFVAHRSQLHRVPEGVSSEEASIAEPASCALHMVLRSPYSRARRSLVYGCGAIGLCVVGCLRAVGCESKIIAIAKYPFQAEKAKEGGADVVLHSSGKELFKEIADHVGGRVVRTRFGNNRFLIGGADVVFDCVGTSETLTNAMKFCRENGTVILAGMAYPGKIDWSSLYFKELDIRGTISSGLEDFEHRKVSAMDLIYDLILEGKLRLAPLITHRFEIGEYRQAFDTILHKKRTGEIKTLFYVDSPSA